MVCAVQLAVAQRLRVHVLGGARHGAARAGLRQPHAAHAVVVAVGAAATERGGIGIAATAPHSASALAVLALPCALHPGELVGVMVAAVPLAAAQRPLLFAATDMVDAIDRQEDVGAFKQAARSLGYLAAP